MDIFGNRIKKELQEQNIKQIELAKHLNVLTSTLCEWVNNHNEPSLEMVAQIAIYLNVTTDYLLGLEDEIGIKNYNNTNNDNQEQIKIN